MISDKLTDEERRTIRLITFDYTHREIAQELEICEKTVSNRIATIAYKLGIMSGREKGRKGLKKRIKHIANMEKIR